MNFRIKDVAIGVARGITFSLCSLVALLIVEFFSPGVQASPVPLGSQDPGRVEGTITAPDRGAVAGAEVKLVGRQNNIERSARSDTEGRFSFSDLSPGTYEVRLQQQGFEPLQQVVDVKLGNTVSLDLELTLAPLTETLTVTATRSEQKLGDVPIQVSILTSDDIKRSAALTVDDVLKQVPSFSLFRRTSSLASHPTTQGVSLRGIGASGTSRTLVMLDGVPHNDHFGNWVYWSKIPPLQIETVEVAEGGLSNLYGTAAMAGVINVTTRKPERSTLSLKGQAGMRQIGDLEAFGSHVIGPLGFSVGGSVFHTGGYKMVRKEERGSVDDDFASSHETVNWRVDYSPAPNITLFHNGRFFDEDRDNGTPLRENSTHEVYLGGGLRAYTSDGSDVQVNFFSHIQTFKSSFTSVRDENGVARALERVALLQDVPSHDIGVNGQWSRRFADMHLITLGADVRRIDMDNKEEVFITGGPNAGFNVRDRLIKGKQTYAGFFFQDFITPVPRVTLLVGARIDYWKNLDGFRTETNNFSNATTVTNFGDTDETTVNPRAGISVHITDDFTLRGSFYQGFRAPTLNELFRPFRVGNVQTNANENLGPERLTGAEGGFNYNITRKLFWRLTGFWNRLKDPVANVTICALGVEPNTNLPCEPDNLITRQRQNLGRARIWGLDTEIVYRVNPQWELRGHYLFDDATIRVFPANSAIEGNRIPQVPKHRASLGVNYYNPNLVNFSLQGRFESLRFDDDLNQILLGSFFVTDLVVSKPLGESWEAFLSVENLFDRRYPVQATPVEFLSKPIIVTGGVRFNFFPR